MISSIHQIDFFPADGSSSIRLLDYGDRMQDPLQFPVSISVDSYAPIGQTYGIDIPKWGARRAIDWSRRTEHASHAAAASYAMRHPASMPYMQTGKLRVTVQGGEVWDFLDSVILGCTSTQAFSGKFATMTTYRIGAGKTVPAYAIALTPGMPMEWIHQNWETLTNHWETY